MYSSVIYHKANIYITTIQVKTADVPLSSLSITVSHPSKILLVLLYIALLFFRVIIPKHASLSSTAQFFFYVYFNFIYLSASGLGWLGLSCTMRDFFMWHANSQLWHVGYGSLSRDQTQASCVRSMESQLLDHQGSTYAMLRYVTSVMSDSVRPHRRQPTGLPRPWDSPGNNTGVGCHFLLQCMKVKSESEVAQLCPTLSDPMDCSLTGSSVHGIFQARVLESGAIAFSRSPYSRVFIGVGGSIYHTFIKVHKYKAYSSVNY